MPTGSIGMHEIIAEGGWGTHLVNVSARLPDEVLLQALVTDDAIAARVSGIGDCLAPRIIQATKFYGLAKARRLIGHVPDTGIYRRETPVLFAD